MKIKTDVFFQDFHRAVAGNYLDDFVLIGDVDLEKAARVGDVITEDGSEEQNDEKNKTQ